MTQRQFFEMMWARWESRGYVACAECFIELKFDIKHCAHIIGKGTEPQMRHDPENLMPLCFYHHRVFDQGMGVYDETHENCFLIGEEIQNRILYLKQKYQV